MYVRLVLCAPLADRVIIRYNSTLMQAKNIVSCGVRMAQNKINTAVHGPTGYEIVKDLDLSDKTCVLTGGNSGIGLEMTRCLTGRGAAVVMASRNKYAAGVVVKNTCDNQRVKLYEANLASLRSVKKFCDDVSKDVKKVDIVILNAGVFGLPWKLTEDRLETTFQVNYLSQFHLLMNIEHILAPDARVVFVSSESHRNINWPIHEQLMPCEELLSLPEHEYTSIKAYNVSKLCGVLAMRYLGHRWAKSAKQVFCAHPGSFVKTRLCRNWWPYEMLYTFMIPFSKNISQAASTPLYCATSPDLRGHSALYLKDCKVCDESDLAKEFHLSFRINDITREILKEREEILTLTEGQVERTTSLPATAKDTEHDTLTAEYS